jgi:putative DNA primase/helicase
MTDTHTKDSPDSDVTDVPDVMSLNHGGKNGDMERTSDVSDLSPLDPKSPLRSPPDEPVEPEIKRPSYRTHNDWFTSNGVTLKPGLYRHQYHRSGNPEDIWICSPIHTVATSRSERGDNHGLLLRFITADGAWREYAMPMQMLAGNGDELRRELLDLGARIHPGQHRHLSVWLMNQYPDEDIVAASRTGWHAEAFVLPARTIGDASVRYQGAPAGHDNFTTAGDLEGWRRDVAEPCRGNPILMLSVSIALAGPLLRLARQQTSGGAGIHLVGDSSRGKTTALQAAASVWGPPEFVRTWRATANGLEATAAGLNDTLLILDEISECDPREIGGIVYSLANGNGKQRANRAGGSRAAQRWRLMALSSGERTLGAHMAEAGRSSKAGQEARLLDLPATGQTHGAFDHLHGCPDGRTFADQIKQTSATHYGHAGPAFVKALLESDADFKALYARMRARPDLSADGGQDGRAAGWFALIALAGELACDYGIVPWNSGEATDTAAWAFGVWRENRGNGQTEDRQILRGVRDFIERHGDARFSSLTGTSANSVRDRAGYWRDGPNGRVFLFFPGALTDAAKGYDIRRITEALENAGWLESREGKSRSTRITIEGGTKTRVYAVRPDRETTE